MAECILVFAGTFSSLFVTIQYQIREMSVSRYIISISVSLEPDQMKDKMFCVVKMSTCSAVIENMIVMTGRLQGV